MLEKIRISVIGSGNLATQLAPALDNSGHQVTEVYSRNIKNAQSLVKKLYNAEVKTDLDFSESISNIFLLAVNDSSIAEVAKEIVLPDNCVLVHTSGSEPLETLLYAAPPHAGVFYPVQTFSKTRKVDFETVPVCIEANDDFSKEVLTYIASGITEKIYFMNSDNRKILHIAAVFACNFTNHLLRISKEILSSDHIDFEILQPLIVETINKSLAMGPENSQTGPAVRGDTKILTEHMNLLRYNQDYMNIYSMISGSILDYSLNKDENI